MKPAMRCPSDEEKKRAERSYENSHSSPPQCTPSILSAGDKVSTFSTRKALSRSRRHLLELMQRYNFSRLEHLEVGAGEPAFDHAPDVTQEIKLGTGNDPRTELDEDYVLLAQIIDTRQRLSKFASDVGLSLIGVRL